MQLVVENAAKMEELGEKLAGLLKSQDIVYLTGDLGVGKTTLVRGIARGLGYEGKVTSPTFTLMNIYEGKFPIFHFDFYRLDEESELKDLGLEDYLGKEGIALVEWAKGSSLFLPEEALFINITLVDDDYEKGRLVSFKACGKKYEEKLKELKNLAGFSR
ncbi:tRNA (adenosine(37)-N6)-threonylcarbamoyltransferase complex ATPase subunit type 1 TsaE [Thermosyntropha sp.]|uniref:tRNA (adenosine(37)-N6)-threonylcarbamoyltransferase complex ATPase subunit type 1 TsaE n=1 Tax=Thermosyntropha sp. TaxID=2740820 RepID=UPI0025EEF5B1|nr:tRNA (adenosine(37)-N6)-threonylcarbamoyltransferase complex ATPase subunit type 1 TsaE [Thermosyntropha sp.]MBO8158255.1 tRNA (adenosine(37)-N6)-threonylcarbamoyltransferase complex ATPase subunit type 1 TsaE [Thermosyntropha sp.]